MRITMNGVTMTIEFDLNRHGQCVGAWSGEPPQCPACGEALTAFGEATRVVSLDVRGRVHCDACGRVFQEVA